MSLNNDDIRKLLAIKKVDLNNVNENNILNTISERLKIIRNQKALTQQKVVDDINKNGGKIAISSLRNYENGYKMPNICNLILLAKYYDVSLDYLVNDEIKTYKTENLDIGKELKLDDRSINTIRTINEKGLNNQFLETINNKYFLTILFNSYDYNILMEFSNKISLILDNIFENNKIDYENLKVLIENISEYRFIEKENGFYWRKDMYLINVVKKCENLINILNNNNNKVTDDKVTLLLKEINREIISLLYYIEDETRLLYRYDKQKEEL